MAPPSPKVPGQHILTWILSAPSELPPPSLGSGATGQEDPASWGWAGVCKHCPSLSLPPRLLWDPLASSVFMSSPWVTLFLSVQGSCPASTDTLPTHSKAFSQEAEPEGASKVWIW